MEPHCQVATAPPLHSYAEEKPPIRRNSNNRAYSLDCDSLLNDEVLFQRSRTIKKSQSYIETNVDSDICYLEQTKISCLSPEELYSLSHQNQQKEKNRQLAERLSPVAKYKVQEYIRRNKMKGIQRRKFSLLMGVPSNRRVPEGNQNKPRFRHPLQKLAQDLDDHSAYFLPPVPPLLQLDDIMNADPRKTSLKQECFVFSVINGVSLSSFDIELD